MTPLKLKLIFCAAGLSYAVAAIRLVGIVKHSMTEWSYTVAPEPILWGIPIMAEIGSLLCVGSALLLYGLWVYPAGEPE